MCGLKLVCLCFVTFVSAQDSQRVDSDPSRRIIDPVPSRRQIFPPPPPPSQRLTQPPLPQRAVYPPFQQRIVYPPAPVPSPLPSPLPSPPPSPPRIFPPVIRGDGNARRICAHFGEEPTYESNGSVQRCVWTIPPCRGREAICRTDGSSYICCQKPYCRDGTRAQGFCASDRECPIGYRCQNYERNQDGICCQRHISRFQYQR